MLSTKKRLHLIKFPWNLQQQQISSPAANVSACSRSVLLLWFQAAASHSGYKLNSPVPPVSLSIEEGHPRNAWATDATTTKNAVKRVFCKINELDFTVEIGAIQLLWKVHLEELTFPSSANSLYCNKKWVTLMSQKKTKEKTQTAIWTD